MGVSMCLCIHTGMWGWCYPSREVSQVLWCGLWSWHLGSNWWSGEGIGSGL